MIIFIRKNIIFLSLLLLSLVIIFTNNSSRNHTLESIVWLVLERKLVGFQGGTVGYSTLGGMLPLSPPTGGRCLTSKMRMQCFNQQQKDISVLLQQNHSQLNNTSSSSPNKISDDCLLKMPKPTDHYNNAKYDDIV